ncbi:MAG: hypothetical protein ACOYIB_03560 [Desulfosporosinus sp.]|jgi:hypothetical protein
MKKSFITFLLLLVLLLMILACPAIAKDTRVTLKQAIEVALLKNKTHPGDNGNLDVTQANTVALNLAEVVIDLDFARKKYQSLVEQQKMLQQEVDKAENDFKIGKINAKTLDALKQKVIRNDFDLNLYKMQIDNGEKSFQRITGTPISEDFDYNSSYLIVDASTLSLPPSVTQGKDAVALEKQLNDVIAAYRNLGTLIIAYIDAGEKLTETENEFKTGKVGQEKLEAAIVDKEKAKIDALEGKAYYAKLLYELDCNLQGFISRDVKKISNPIFQ